MSNISVAIVENDVVATVGKFDGATFSPEMWAEVAPQWELIPLSQLPEGCWIGWQRDELGNWFDPNAQAVEPEGEAP